MLGLGVERIGSARSSKAAQLVGLPAELATYPPGPLVDESGALGEANLEVASLFDCVFVETTDVELDQD